LGGTATLGPRYQYDGKPILRLNATQRAARDEVESKVRRGTYEFETVDCPVCGGVEFEQLSEKDRYGLRMSVVACTACGLIQTNPRMTQASYDEFYNSEYRRLYVGEEVPTDEFFQTQRRRGAEIFGYLVEQGALPKQPRDSFVLEVGCGAGGILQYFREQGCRVKGIDLGEEYLTFGVERHGLDLSAGTIADLELDRTSDVVIYSHVAEHLLDPVQELRHVREIIDPSGALYVATPGVKYLEHSYETDFLRLLQNAHTYHFTLKSLRNLLGASGFEMLAGDETIKAVFKRSPVDSARLAGAPDQAVYDSDFDSDFDSDYEDVLAYLRRIEKSRRGAAAIVRKSTRAARRAALGTLKKTRLHDVVRPSNGRETG